MKITSATPVESGQKYEIDLFKPEDAKGIANLYYSIYGPNYPFETYYIPEKIIEENKNGNIYSVVARTPKGDIIAHGALYRSSPHYKNLYEGGQYVSLKNYRNTFAIFKINKYVAEVLARAKKIDGMFGEAVGHHKTSQKTADMIGAKGCAIEIDLMPKEVYEQEKTMAERVSESNRTSCIILFQSYNDRPQEVFIHSSYKEEINFILSDLNIERKISFSEESIPSGLKSDVSVNFFPYASVGRFNVITGGEDFEHIITALEQEGEEKNILIFQYFLNIDKPWTGELIKILRNKGYFFGGYIPRWFDSDSILMQKVLTKPDFDSICIYTEKVKKLLSFIKKDWESGNKNEYFL